MPPLLVYSPDGRAREFIELLSGEFKISCLPSRIHDPISLFENWPFPYRRAWVLLGDTQLPPEFQIPRPWLSDEFEASHFDQLQSWAEEHATWAIFAYFSGYQTNYLMMFLRDDAQQKKVCDLLERVDISPVESYLEASSQDLRNLVFTHDGVEGLIPRRIAQELNQLPLLLCRFEAGYDYEWNRNWLEQLSEVRSWQDSSGSSKYSVYLADHREAYQQLWLRTGLDDAVCEAVLSPEVSVEHLSKHLANNHGILDPIRLDANWSYSLQYGGGADEHLAHWRSKRPALNARVAELIEQKASKFLRLLSRF